MRIDHLGVATDDLAGTGDLLSNLLGAPVAHEETFDGLRVVFLDCGNASIELLEPIEDEGPIARFLDRRGPGIHHVAIETDDVEAALATARDLGIELVDEEPRPGARGHRVAFLHPGSTGGVLVEFVEP